MKSTGIVRKVDDLGRIVLPMELRKSLDVKERDALEVFTEDDTIVLRKYSPYCALCESMNNTVHFHGKLLCQDCIKSIKEAGI